VFQLAALLVAITSTATNLLYLAGYLLSDAFQHQVWWANSAMVGLSLLMAAVHCRKRSKLYLPYLIGNVGYICLCVSNQPIQPAPVQAITVVVKIVFLILLITLIAVLEPAYEVQPAVTGTSTNSSTPIAITTTPPVPRPLSSSLLDEWKSHFIMVVTFLYLLDIGLSLWYEWIVYRAYKFVHTWQWNEQLKRTTVLY